MPKPGNDGQKPENNQEPEIKKSSALRGQAQFVSPHSKNPGITGIKPPKSGPTGHGGAPGVHTPEDGSPRGPRGRRMGR